MDLAEHPLKRFFPKKTRTEPKLSPTPCVRRIAPPPKSPPRLTTADAKRRESLAASLLPALISVATLPSCDGALTTGEGGSIAGSASVCGWLSETTTPCTSEDGRRQTWADFIVDQAFDIADAFIREALRQRGRR